MALWDAQDRFGALWSALGRSGMLWDALDIHSYIDTSLGRSGMLLRGSWTLLDAPGRSGPLSQTLWEALGRFGTIPNAPPRISHDRRRMFLFSTFSSF